MFNIFCTWTATVRDEHSPCKSYHTSAKIYFRSPFFSERNVGSRKISFFEGCIRIPSSWEPDRVKGELIRAFGAFLPLYPEGDFEVSVAANAVLQSQRDSSFSLFYGLDHQVEDDRPRRGPLSVTNLYKVNNVSDVSDLPTSFPIEDFDNAFREALPDTTVFVREIVNVVYIVRRAHKDLTVGGSAETSSIPRKGKFVKI